MTNSTQQENTKEPRTSFTQYGDKYVALHCHSQYSYLDGVITPQQYAEECQARGIHAHALTEHGHMGSVAEAYWQFKKYDILQIAGCFLPQQRVISDDIMPISGITPGSNVLTHKNNYKKVKNLQIRDYSGPIVRIKAWGVEDQIATPEHPFLVRQVERFQTKKGVWHDEISTEFRKASTIERLKYWRTYSTKKSKDRSNKRRYKHYLCVPRLPYTNSIKSIYLVDKIFTTTPHTVTSDNSTIYSVTYQDVGYKKTNVVNLPTHLELTNELLWIMGLWLAEGSEKDGLVFSLSHDESHFYTRIVNYFNQFGIYTGYSERYCRVDGREDELTGLEVVVYSSYFGRLFSKLFGRGFADKRINEEMLFGLSSEQSYWLLEGLLDGDSKRNEYSSYLKLNNETLVWQARMLMTKLDVPQYSAITEAPSSNSANMSYTVRKRESGHFYYDYDADYIYLPVYEVTEEHYDGNVYNLEVEDDNSYQTGVAVHNCEIYYNDYEPVRQQLVQQGAKIASKDWKLTNPIEYYRIVRNRHLTVLAKNQTGFHNLLKLTTEAYRDGAFGMGTTKYNRIWFDKLVKYKEGLIILSGCLNGPVAHELRFTSHKNKEGEVIWERSKSEAFEAAAAYVKKFKDAFGENYWIETQMPGIDGDDIVFRDLHQLADDFKLKTVITNDIHYKHREDHIIQMVMMAISQGVTVDSPDLFHVNSSEQYFKTRAELRQYFLENNYSNLVPQSAFEESCDNTLEIASQCTPISVSTDVKLPRFEGNDQKLAEICIKSLVRKGLHSVTKRYNVDGNDVNYLEQLKIELDRIKFKGFSSYFLVLQDIVSYGRSKNALFGPRGCSIPGSKVNTPYGPIKIERLNAGDYVYDGYGTLSTVLESFVYDVDEEIVSITHSAGSVQITADHKLYVLRNNSVELLKASEIVFSDKLITGADVLVNCNIRKDDRLTVEQANIKALNLYIEYIDTTDISDIQRAKYTGPVYDIHVADTNCYQLNGVFSSNSAGGCLVCFLLGLSSLDPLKWGLSFDRFLSPSRGGYMLDIAMPEPIK